jgi:hypothetical protein
MQALVSEIQITDERNFTCARHNSGPDQQEQRENSK